ncbi:hypothetical protein IWQ61_009606 [Dispira simplex]|nr:hypothetical protein IWQ61_009606 [Dispira simplex]
MIFELLVIIVVALCGYIPWLYWRSKTPTPDMATKSELHVKDTELQAKDSVIKAIKGELQVRDIELQATKGELHVKDTELQAKDTEFQTGRQELQSRDTTISALKEKVKKVVYEKN